MRKSNCKEVKQAIRAYILELTEAEEIATIEYINQRFINEYGWNIQRAGRYNAFKEWLGGLALNIAFYHEDVNKLLQGWLDATDEEVAKYDDHASWDLFLHLLTREFFYMVDSKNTIK